MSARDADRRVSGVLRRFHAREAREPLETVRRVLLVFAVEHLEIHLIRARRFEFPYEFDGMPVRDDGVVSAVVDGNGDVFQFFELSRGGSLGVFVRYVRRAAAQARLHVVHIMLMRFREVRVPRREVGHRAPDVHGAEHLRGVLRGQQRGMSAARPAQEAKSQYAHFRTQKGI